MNLAPTEYLDSTALGMFVGILRRLQEKGGSLHLVAPPPRLRRLFEITRLERILPIVPDEACALTKIAQAQEGAK